jgi:hypothetical protein
MTQATVEFADIDRLFVKNACLSVSVFVASELEFPITIVQNLADVFLRHSVPPIEAKKPARKMLAKI